MEERVHYVWFGICRIDCDICSWIVLCSMFCVHVMQFSLWCLVFRLMIHVREADVMEERSAVGTQLFDLLVEILAHVLAFLDYGTLHNVFPFVSRKCEQLSRNVGPRFVFNLKHSAISGGVTEKELRRVCDGNVDVCSVRSHLDRFCAITLSCALVHTIRLSHSFSTQI